MVQEGSLVWGLVFVDIGQDSRLYALDQPAVFVPIGAGGLQAILVFDKRDAFTHFTDKIAVIKKAPIKFRRFAIVTDQGTSIQFSIIVKTH